MQVDGKQIDEFVERLIRDNKEQEVTVELVCNIAGRAMATSMNELSKVPSLELCIRTIEGKIIEIQKSIAHSDGNVKLMTGLLDKYLSHAKMSAGCKLEVSEAIEEYLEKTKDGLIKTITDTVNSVMKNRREDNKFWMEAIKWAMYVIPTLIGYWGVLFFLS